MVNDFQKIAKELEEKYDIKYYEALQRFMFERILERISVSKYQDNFILKGGLLLSAMFGISNRTTKDMDTTIKGIDISKENMVKILNEILSIKLDDHVKFDIVDISDIREDDEYGGNKYYIVGRINNTKINLEIDISTGDEITPREMKFKYPLLFSNKSILISSYNLETLLSEKIETILRRGKHNSRMKDFYDIYYFTSKLNKDIDANTLKKAINNTFSKRDSLNYLNDYKQIIDSIIEDDNINILWTSYCKKNYYAKGININEILLSLKKYIDDLNLNE